jgi:hypothetical protein
VVEEEVVADVVEVVEGEPLDVVVLEILGPVELVE